MTLSDTQTLLSLTDITWYNTILFNFVPSVQLDYLLIDQFTQIPMVIKYICRNTKITSTNIEFTISSSELKKNPVVDKDAD